MEEAKAKVEEAKRRAEQQVAHNPETSPVRTEGKAPVIEFVE